MSPPVKHPLLGLAAWLVVCLVAGGVGAAASVQAADFYAQLARPSWAPPSALFGPVWTVLYILMALAAWQVWRVGGFRAARRALSLFLIQLALNALWSWLFFGWHLGRLAFADIVVLWALILATTVAFKRHGGAAMALMLPYLLWVSFATALNFAVWKLNPQLLGT